MFCFRTHYQAYKCIDPSKTIIDLNNIDPRSQYKVAGGNLKKPAFK